MRYDFETVVDRSCMGSVKWEQMKQWCPEVAPGVVPFSIADMELKNPPELLAGLKDYLDEAVLGYSDATPAYLEAVCGWMARRHGWTVKPEWVQGSPGVIAGFYTAIKALTAPGDGVIIQTPVYYPFFNAIRSTGRTLAGNPLVQDGGRYGIDFDDLERQAREPRNKVLLFCSPTQPRGAGLDPGRTGPGGRDLPAPRPPDHLRRDPLRPGHARAGPHGVRQGLRRAGPANGGVHCPQQDLQSGRHADQQHDHSRSGPARRVPGRDGGQRHVAPERAGLQGLRTGLYPVRTLAGAAAPADPPQPPGAGAVLPGAGAGGARLRPGGDLPPVDGLPRPGPGPGAVGGVPAPRGPGVHGRGLCVRRSGLRVRADEPGAVRPGCCWRPWSAWPAPCAGAARPWADSAGSGPGRSSLGFGPGPFGDFDPGFFPES